MKADNNNKEVHFTQGKEIYGSGEFRRTHKVLFNKGVMRRPRTRNQERGLGINKEVHCTQGRKIGPAWGIQPNKLYDCANSSSRS